MLYIKKIKPLFNQLITTTDKYLEDVVKGSLVDVKKLKGTVKEYQKVLAVGSMVKDIKVGDLVLIDPKRYQILKHEKGSLKDGVITDNPVIGYNIPMVTINNEECMLLYDQDIKYVVEEYEDVEDPKPSSIYQPPTDVIV